MCRASRSYDSFSMESLCETFELQRNQMISTINRMIIKNKLQAHFDVQSDMLILDEERKLSNEAKELQQLSVQYADKLESMIENNERLIDMIAGGSLYT